MSKGRNPTKRIKDLIKVVLFVSICIASLTFMYQLEGKTSPPNNTTSLPSDTITSVPVFHEKPAKEGLKEALTYYEIQFPDIVYAQAILETGHFKSIGCIQRHNLFGLYNSKTKKYYRFNHWTESVVAYKEWIQERYRPPEDYYSFLQRIGYAEDPYYINKLKRIVNSNDKGRNLEGGKDYS